MTDEQYAEVIAFAISRSLNGIAPVPVRAVLPEGDPPRLIDRHPRAPHLGGPEVFLSPRDARDLTDRSFAESGFKRSGFGWS